MVKEQKILVFVCLFLSNRWEDVFLHGKGGTDRDSFGGIVLDANSSLSLAVLISKY